MKNEWFQKKIKELSSLQGYQKPEKQSEALKLDSNENFVINKQFQRDLIDGAKKISDVREYPLRRIEKIIEALSKNLKVSPSMIGVGNGSNPIFDLLYLDSPNNPTGFQFPKKDLEKLIKNFDGPVIIDEAYVEFGDYSVLNMVKSQNNLIVVRTFSKEFGLAGLRLGYFVANKAIADVFTRIIQYPYPLNTIAIEAGILALQKSKIMSDAATLIKKERKRIIENLRKTNTIEVFDSKANFVLFDAKGADQRIYTALVEQGISIRKLGKIGKHQGCLRVTVGTKEMNSKFLLAIRDLLQ